jgi:hypothetical protein
VNDGGGGVFCRIGTDRRRNLLSRSPEHILLLNGWSRVDCAGSKDNSAQGAAVCPAQVRKSEPLPNSWQALGDPESRENVPRGTFFRECQAEKRKQMRWRTAAPFAPRENVPRGTILVEWEGPGEASPKWLVLTGLELRRFIAICACCSEWGFFHFRRCGTISWTFSGCFVVSWKVRIVKSLSAIGDSCH